MLCFFSTAFFFRRPSSFSEDDSAGFGNGGFHGLGKKDVRDECRGQCGKCRDLGGRGERKSFRMDRGYIRWFQEVVNVVGGAWVERWLRSNARDPPMCSHMASPMRRRLSFARAYTLSYAYSTPIVRLSEPGTELATRSRPSSRSSHPPLGLSTTTPSPISPRKCRRPPFATAP